jgi:hypothetical protein
MTIKELRSKRIAAEIPATLLAARAGVNRSRLSGRAAEIMEQQLAEKKPISTISSTMKAESHDITGTRKAGKGLN